jgi:hypothetical protein
MKIDHTKARDIHHLDWLVRKVTAFKDWNDMTGSIRGGYIPDLSDYPPGYGPDGSPETPEDTARRIADNRCRRELAAVCRYHGYAAHRICREHNRRAVECCEGHDGTQGEGPTREPQHITMTVDEMGDLGVAIADIGHYLAEMEDEVNEALSLEARQSFDKAMARYRDCIRLTEPFFPSTTVD